MAVIDKGMLDAINRLRGIGGSPGQAEKVDATPENTTTSQPNPQSVTHTAEKLSTGNPENMQNLANFLNHPDAAPTENIEKKYTMQDLDDFIESLVKPK